MKYIGENLKTIRKVWDKSQDEFALMFKLNRGNINSYEGERNEPSIEFFILLEEFTGIPIRRLYFEKIEKGEISERPLRNGDGLARIANSNVNIQLGDSNGDVVQQLGAHEREVYEERLRDKEEINRLLRNELAQLKAQIED